MASPFDFLTSGSDDQSAPSQPTGAPNPLQRAFAPERGSWAGFFGGLMGVPSADERKAADEGALMQKLTGHLESASGSPQKAIVNFMQSPEGLQLMSRPGAVDLLKKWTDSITPPAPTQLKLGPGEYGETFQNGQPTSPGKFNPASQNIPPGDTGVISQGPNKTQAVQQNPPTEVQNTAGLINMMSAQTPDTLNAIVQGKLDPAATAQRAIAISRMNVPADVKNRLLAGTMAVHELKDEWGKPSGQFVMTDLSTGSAQTITPNTGPVQAQQQQSQISIPSNVPGAPPHIIPNSALLPDGSIDAAQMTDKKYMGLGVGLPSSTVYLMGRLVRQGDVANNEQQSQLATLRDSQHKQLDAALVSLGSAQEGRLKAQVEVWRQQLPSQTFGSPTEAYQRYISLYEHLDRMKQTELGIYQNQKKNGINYPEKQRMQALETMQSIQNVLDSMPSPSDSRQMIEDIKKGKAGAVTPLTVLNSGIEMGKSAVNSLDRQRQDFQKPQQPQQPRTLQGPASAPQRPAQPGQQQSQPQLQPEQEQQPTATLPEPKDLMKLDLGSLQQAYSLIPPGPNAHRQAYEARLQSLLSEIQARKKKAQRPLPQ